MEEARARKQEIMKIPVALKGMILCTKIYVHKGQV